jgi:phytoene/squalene synthetase
MCALYWCALRPSLSCREHDNDQYLCSILLPPDSRAGVHILRAFNLELAHVVSRHAIQTVGSAELQDTFNPEAARAAEERLALALLEPHHITEQEENQLRVGLMKLQWWRDGLETALETVQRVQYKPEFKPPSVQSASSYDRHVHNRNRAKKDAEQEALTAAHAQPVLSMLAIAVKQYSLSDKHISRMIEGRETALADGQPADIDALVEYSEATSSSLLYLTLECLAIREEHAYTAASHIGKAMGIVLTLRSLPYSASKRQILIPKSLVESVSAGERRRGGDARGQSDLSE